MNILFAKKGFILTKIVLFWKCKYLKPNLHHNYQDACNSPTLDGVFVQSNAAFRKHPL